MALKYAGLQTKGFIEELSQGGNWQKSPTAIILQSFLNAFAPNANLVLLAQV